MHKSVKSYLKTGPTRQVKRNTYITLVYYDHVKTQTVQTRGKIWRYPHYYLELTVNRLT